MYGREAENQGSHVCQGAVCFTSTFRVGVVGGFISLVILLFAIHRTGIYRRYIAVDRIN
jgi:hypothetical protein